MCDINANGPPVGPCLHHRARAWERGERGERGRQRNGVGDKWGERWGVGKIREEKSRKTSQECKCAQVQVLVCAAEIECVERNRYQRYFQLQDSYLRTRDYTDHRSVLTSFIPQSFTQPILHHNLRNMEISLKKRIQSIYLFLPCHGSSLLLLAYQNVYTSFQ